MRQLARFLKFVWRVLTAPFRWTWRLISALARGLATLRAEFRTFFVDEPEDAPVTDAFAKAVQNPQDIFYHLDALRKHLLRVVLVLLLTTAASFAFTGRIFELLALPLEGGIESLQSIEVTENIGVFMRVALISGFSIALPYIFFELWLFAAPGLKRRSRIMGLFSIPIITFFFLAGMAFAYYVMLPTALPFLTNFMGIRTVPRPADYFRFVTGLMFWVGVSFQFPLVIFVLASIGLVNTQMLLRQSRLAVVLMAVVAAAITPTIDPINMLLVWAPLVALYYLGVLLSIFAGRRRATPSP